MTKLVYLLSLISPESDDVDEDWKIVGVYDSTEIAQRTVDRMRNHVPKDVTFHLGEFDLNVDSWTDGFVM